jgi:hypothetical protein
VLDLTCDGGPATVLGVLSLIVWTLFAITTIKYVAIGKRVDNDGEGSILAAKVPLETTTGQAPIAVPGVGSPCGAKGAPIGNPNPDPVAAGTLPPGSCHKCHVT